MRKLRNVPSTKDNVCHITNFITLFSSPGALSAMASAKALHEVGILLGHNGVGEEGLSIKMGSWEGVGLCVAAGLHFCVVVYAAVGMLGVPSLTSFGRGYVGRRF
jgi:hypothetical protein